AAPALDGDRLPADASGRLRVPGGEPEPDVPGLRAAQRRAADGGADAAADDAVTGRQRTSRRLVVRRPQRLDVLPLDLDDDDWIDDRVAARQRGAALGNEHVPLGDGEGLAFEAWLAAPDVDDADLVLPQQGARVHALGFRLGAARLVRQRGQQLERLP